MPAIVKPQIRWMIRSDMPRIMEIENASFLDPLQEEDILGRLRRTNSIGMVAVTRSENIAGFVIYELESKSVNIIDFAVDPAYRRSGVGTAMIDRMKEKLAINRRHMITSIVNERNILAQIFYRSCGFAAVEVWRDYFCDETGDAQDAYFFKHSLME